MRYGHSVPDGFLPVYSVADEKEANELLTLSCATNINREFVARELVEEQTLENLQAFSDRLHEMHSILVKNGRCRCKTL